MRENSYSRSIFRTAPFRARKLNQILKLLPWKLGLLTISVSEIIQINPNHFFNPNESEVGVIRIENSVWIIFSSESFGFIWGLEGLYWVGLKIISDWLRWVRIQISKWIGIDLIGSEWISIRNFSFTLLEFLNAQWKFHFSNDKNYSTQNNVDWEKAKSCSCKSLSF